MEFDVLTLCVNQVQQHLSHASELYYAPMLDETPDSLDSFELPIALSDMTASQFNDAGGLNFGLISMTSRILVDNLGGPSLALRKTLASQIFDEVMAHFLDKDNYQKVTLPDGTLGSTGSYTLSLAPVRLEIIAANPTFVTQGIRVFQYPEGVNRPWYGFEVSYKVNAQWPFEC